MDTAARRLLATMPLHAITTTYGEDGLRDRFAQEIGVFGQADRRRVERALALAGRLHAADRRQREPYVNHLLRVAIRILCHYGVRDPDVVCAALLHDAVEDHAAELAASGGGRAEPVADGGVQAAPTVGGGQPAADGGRQTALTVLAAEFGPRVAELVAAVTNPVWRPGLDQHEQYREHVAASLESCPWARVIKVSDFTDNGVGLIHTTGAALDQIGRAHV